MGATAEIFVFDYATYTGEVAPAFRRLLRTGEADPWLADLIARFNARQARNQAKGWRGSPFFNPRHWVPTEIAHAGSYLDADLAITIPAEAVGAPVGPFGQLHCHNHDCAYHATCPFYHPNYDIHTEHLLYLIQAAIRLRCLGASQRIGRNTSIFDLQDYLQEEAGYSPTHPALELLNLLYYRGLVVGYAFANSDGVKGWLQPAECAALVESLAAARLPTDPTSFAAMQDLLTNDVTTPRLALLLTCVRTVARMAATSGNGILWGNDLGTFEDLR